MLRWRNKYSLPSPDYNTDLKSRIRAGTVSATKAVLSTADEVTSRRPHSTLKAFPDSKKREQVVDSSSPFPLCSVSGSESRLVKE